MGGGPDHGVNLGCNPGRLIVVDVVSATEGGSAGPEDAAVTLELHAGEASADVFGLQLFFVVCASSIFVVLSVGFAIQAV